MCIPSFLPLGATAQGELWPPEQSVSILLSSSSTGFSYLPCRIYFILEADYLVSQQFNFYGVRLLVSCPTPNLEDQGIPLCLDLSGMGDSTNSYATASIALRVSGALKPHHHDKVETPSVGITTIIHYNKHCGY
jgi:hypothetical protein